MTVVETRDRRQAIKPADSKPQAGLSGTARRKQSRPRDVVYRPATPADGREMWRFVRDAGVLELNQSYAYVLMCQHFGNTCLVAETEVKMVGFVLAYIPPRQPDTVFVWQIGVAREVRGRGVGLHLLRHLLALDGCRNVRYLEASVTPSNKPSQSLFRAFARKWGVSCRKLPFFPSEFFPEPHEPEYLYRVGPLQWPAA
ncbi:MAG: diaminobutyrate acetyltransferase [Arenicellales bacterium]|jgi:L-2,4-diaminobutyric acid acetyltransferase